MARNAASTPQKQPAANVAVSTLLALGLDIRTNLNAAALMQYRLPLGAGPSLKMWPRWASQRAQFTSILCMPRLSSSCIRTFNSETGSQKLGQPVPDSNLVLTRNRSVPQQTHW